MFRQGDIATGKKVLLISHELNLTGAPIAVGYLAEYFVQRGDFPVLLSPNDGGLRQSLAQQMPVIVDNKAYNGGFVSQLSVAFDMVVVNTTVGGPAVAALNGTSVPVMWWIHEAKASYPSEILHAMPETLMDNIHVYCVGKWAQEMLKAHCPSYTSEILMYYIPDYVNTMPKTRQFRKNADNKKMVFAVVGVQEERKGQDRLVDAIKLLPEKQLKDCLFVFVGKKYYPPIEKKISNICTMYPDNTEYIEEIPREEMVGFYSAIDCLICTSLDDPMPIVVTEAMEFSKLVICSENTGSAAVLEEYQSGFVYRNNDPVELSVKIMDVLEAHEEELVSMRRNARKTYEEVFSSIAFHNAIETVMDEIFPNEVLHPCGDMVSVVIPTYNGAEELSTLIPVLQSQEKVREVEIIVVDSGSQDGTADIAEKLGARVIRIPQEEFSHSYARNLGASHATGDYLLFMTQDALPKGNSWLVRMLQPVLKGDAVAVSCRQIPKLGCDLFGRFAVLFHAQYMGIISEDRILSLPKVKNYETLRLNAQLDDVSCLIVRDVFNKYQYRGNYAEDLDLGLRLIRDNYKLALLSSVQVIHSHSRSPFIIYADVLWTRKL